MKLDKDERSVNMDAHINSFTPNLKALELLESVIKNGRQYYKMTFHPPTLEIKPGEYYVVEVRRIELPDMGRLEEALPFVEYEVVT